MNLNNKTKKFLANFANSFSSNLISMSISFVITIFAPRFFGVKEFSYWQLYYFYINYVGIFHFGWNDGIYLRYGGKEYKNIDKVKMHSQFVVQFLIEILIAIIINIISLRFNLTSEKRVIILGTTIAMVLTNIRFFLIYILQASYKIKEYSRIIIIDRSIFLLCVLLLLFVKFFDFYYLIIADLIGRTISLGLGFFYCKEIIFEKKFKLDGLKEEIFLNIGVGCKLMFANFGGLLITGIVRQGIESTWDIVTFGKISLMISLSNIFIAFINTLGIVTYPILKNTSNEKMKEVFKSLNLIIIILLFFSFVLFNPFQYIIGKWLPQYKDSVKYMILLFPLVIYEGKMSLLYNTFLKALRKEAVLMKINIFMVAVSFIFTIITTKVFENLNMSVFSILLLSILRSTIAEIYLGYIFKVNVYKKIIFSSILTSMFVYLNWFFNAYISFTIYISVYFILITYFGKELKIAVQKILNIMK